MNAKQLRKKLEQEWQRPGCADPLRPAAWMLDGYKLVPYDESFLADQDDGRPLPPNTSR